MEIKNLGIRKQLAIYHITMIGNAIGNAYLIKGMYDDAKIIWNRATEVTTGEHLIESVVLNNDRKAQAINDYALQVLNVFISSQYPTASLFTKRANMLAAEHRKNILYRMASTRYETHQALFTAVVTELLCFDPYITQMGLSEDHGERSMCMAQFIASMVGDFISEEDWNPIHEELSDQLASYNFDIHRQEFINACLELTINSETDLDIYQTIEQVIANQQG